MRTNLVFLAILFSVMLVDSCIALTTQEVVQRVQEEYEKICSLTADFTQESTSKMLNQTRITKAKGKAFFKKSGFMRWEYTTSPKNLWVSDGKTLWLYQPEENQVIVEKVDPETGRVFLAFVMGEGDLTEEFDIHRWDQEVEESDEGYRIELTPKQPHAMMDRLILTVDRKTSYVEGTEIYDAYGNLTQTRFKRVRVNRELPSDLFTFEIPPGTEVIQSHSEHSQ